MLVFDQYFYYIAFAYFTAFIVLGLLVSSSLLKLRKVKKLQAKREKSDS